MCCLTHCSCLHSSNSFSVLSNQRGLVTCTPVPQLRLSVACRAESKLLRQAFKAFSCLPCLLAGHTPTFSSLYPVLQKLAFFVLHHTFSHPPLPGETSLHLQVTHAHLRRVSSDYHLLQETFLNTRLGTGTSCHLFSVGGNQYGQSQSELLCAPWPQNGIDLAHSGASKVCLTGCLLVCFQPRLYN